MLELGPIRLRAIRLGSIWPFFDQGQNHPPFPSLVVGKNNIVRVCVKASPAEGRRRLQRNTAHAHLSGLSRLRVHRWAFRVQCFGVQGFSVQGLGFGVWGLGPAYSNARAVGCAETHPSSARCEFVFQPQPPIVFIQYYYFECQGQQVISQLSTTTPGVSVILKKETAGGRLLLPWVSVILNRETAGVRQLPPRDIRHPSERNRRGRPLPPLGYPSSAVAV